jgi:hypothetical protein
MAGTFHLGAIPSFSVFEGETLAFTVTSSLGSGALFSIEASPKPEGQLAVNELDGVVTYQPSPKDREEFELWVRARAGDKRDQQRVRILPQPRLLPEAVTIEHRGQRIERKSSLYTTIAEHPLAQGVFNNEADIDDRNESSVTREILEVLVAGVEVVLEPNSGSHPVYARLAERTDIGVLTIAADEVVIRGPIELPGTDVRIHARVLRFEDPSESVTACIVTTPRFVDARARNRDEALHGQAGGAVYLVAQSIEAPGTAVRIITDGGAGQAARLGKAGEPGASLAQWNGKFTVSTHWSGIETLDWSSDFSRLGGFKPVYAQLWQHYALREVWKDGWWHIDNAGSKTWPGDGSAPKVMPGRPGQGGHGGNIYYASSNEAPRLEVRQQPGQPGGVAKDIEPAPAGEPVRSCWVKARYIHWVVPSMDPGKPGDAILSRREYLEEIENHEAKPGPGAKAPPADPNKAPKHGELLRVQDQTWLHPAAARAVLAWASDSFLAGHQDAAELVLAPWTEAITAANLSVQDIEWASIASSLIGLLDRIRGPFDSFGNPAGWVPMLSFESNLRLYQREVEDSMRTLFLAYWMENTQAKEQSAASAINTAIDQLATESAAALRQYETAIARLGDLHVRVDLVVRDIREMGQRLEQVEAELRRRATFEATFEAQMRASAKLIGAVLQLIPVGQPALGAFGKGVTVLSDMDFEKPLSSLPDLAGAFSSLAEQKLLPKVTKLFDSLNDEGRNKDKKKDEKQEEFDKAVATAKLTEKVKGHLQAQKDARAQALGAFSSFAASQDDIDARLAKAVANTPEFAEIVADIHVLNERKSRFVEELLAALEAIDRASGILLRNHLGRIELRAQLGQSLSRLSLEALQSVRDMGQRARHRLLRYQYYLLRSYHYLMLRDLPTMDFRPAAMLDAFAELLPDSEAGSLSAAQHERLRVVFEAQLGLVTDAIIEWYRKHPPRKGGSFVVSLTPTQLETLNGPAGRLELNLHEMGYLDLQQEDVRITDIQAHLVELAHPPTWAANVNLTYRHGRVSYLRRGGHVFQFRTGDYAVDATDEDGTSATKYRDDHMVWRTVIEHDGTQTTIKPSQPDPAEESVIRHLIGKKDGGAPLLDYRPAAWADLTIHRSVTPIGFLGKLANLTLRVEYVSHNVDPRTTTVLVHSTDGEAPLVRVSAPDIAYRDDGRGLFLRTYDASRTDRITLTAPPRWGNRREFVGWWLPGDEGPQGMAPLIQPGDPLSLDGPGRLSTDRKLVLDLTKRSAIVAMPRFAALAVTPEDPDRSS